LELKRLIVQPEWQGKGVGSTVLQLLKGRGKKIVLYPLSDDGHQEDLERFYLRAGFVPDFFDPETFVWEP
jgi:tRNA(Met) C34 N-acetyltransferase TmcA